MDNPKSTCTKIYRKARSKLKTNLTEIIEKGIASGEFVKVEIDATTDMLIAVLRADCRKGLQKKEASLLIVTDFPSLIWVSPTNLK